MTAAGPALQQKWDDATISAPELELRLLILQNIGHANFHFGDDKHLHLGPSWNGVVPIPGKENKAHTELWDKENYYMGCTLGSKIAIRKAIIDLADEDPRRLERIRKDIQEYFANTDNNENNAFWKFTRKDAPGFKTSELTPGDLVMFYNPYYFRNTVADQRRWTGEARSHVFYVGSGKVMSIYLAHNVETIEQHQKVMAGWPNVIKINAHAPLTDFPILERYQPLVVP